MTGNKSSDIGKRPTKPKLNASILASNKHKHLRLSDVMSLSLGVASGVLGLESTSGFALYFVGILLTNLSFLVICCQWTPSKFFAYPWKSIMADGLATSLAGFVMMWCLTYALVT